jgi:hypothetical protein
MAEPTNAPKDERIAQEDLASWAKKLDTTEMQLKDAIGRVGDRAADVEMDLKGTHSTTNDDRVEQAGG